MLTDPIADHLSNQYFAMSDKAAQQKKEMLADHFWYMAIICYNAALSLNR